MKKWYLVTIIILIFVCITIIIVNEHRYPIFYKKEIKYYANYYHLNASLVMSVVYAESSFDNEAKSNKGALGLMQIMPNTADWIAGELEISNYSLFDVDVNLNFGCFYLNYLFSKFNTEIEVLCAYNAGETNVINWKKNGEITLNNIPFEETKNYVNKILKFKKFYENKV